MKSRTLLGAVGSGVAICALFFGCGGGVPESDLQFMNGRFITDGAVSVFPDRHWRRHGQLGGSFRKNATLLVWIEAEAPDDLVFSFTPDGDTERFHFAASFDEVELWADARTGGGELLEAAVPKTLLAPGLHRLTIERRQKGDVESDRGIVENQFSRVRVFARDGGQTRELDIRVNAFIASFLEFGLTGQSPVREDGCLFDGPGELAATVSSVGPANAGFVLENRSREEALFRVRVGGEGLTEFQVAARGRLTVNLDLPGGAHKMTFEVEGVEDGAFLWGAPYLERKGAGPSPPPIFFLSLDTTRWDAVAPYADQGLTPNLAAFARHATVYTNAWATAPWTLPSHASMFTGLYPSHHGAGVTFDALPSAHSTLAERLRAHGYRTGGFIGGHMSSSVFGIAQGFSVYHDPPGWEVAAEVITDAALSFIDESPSVPQFVFVNYFDPHEPYAAPEKYRKLAGADEAAGVIQNLPVWGPLARAEKGAWNAVRQGKAPYSAPGIEFLTRSYLAEIASMDAQIGRLFDRLRQHGIYDRAMIVAVSDHGEFLGENGLYSHSYRLDPELTRVPLLIKWPGQTESVAVGDLVSHVDLFETVLAAAGLEAASSDGHSLDRTAGPLGNREMVFMEEHACSIHPLLGPFKIADHLFGLQWRKRREVLAGRDLECRVLEAGTWQPVPCGGSWEDRAALLSEQMRSVAQISAEHAAADLDEDEAEKLRALGYLD